MPKAVAFQNITVTAGGGTTTILSTSMTEKVILSTSGAIVMAGNYVITHDGAWVEGSELQVLWTGSATLGAFNITLFGYALTQAQATAGNLEGTAYAKSGTVVFTPKLTTGSAQVGTADLAALSVTTAKIDNLAVTSGKLAASSVIAGKIAAGTIVNADVDAAAAIVYTKLNLSNSIVNADVNTTAAIDVSKLEAMSDGEIITGNTGGGNIATIVPVSSDIALANTGAMTIQPGVVTPEKGTTNLIEQALPVFIDFQLQNGEGKYSVTMGENFELLDVWCNLDSDAAHNIQIDMNINGVAVTGGVINFTAGDPKNTNNQGTAITANNTGAAGDVVNFILTVDPTETASGSVSLIYKKTS